MEDKSTQFHYRYPLTKLESSDDYLKITVLEYKPPGFIPASGFSLPTAGEVSGYGIENEKGTIILPIPDNVQDINNTSWGNSTVGPLSAMALGGGESFIKNPGGALGSLLGTINNLGGAAKTGSTQKYLQALGITLASNTLLGQQRSIDEVSSRYAGVVSNSNIELIFTSVNLREPFSFGFDITPRSEKEARMVKEIIKKLKMHSAAKKSVGAATGLFLKAPEVFKIQYMNGGRPHPYLNKFKVCALQNISVNYTGSGTYATYSDATPVHMVLNLTFRELTPIYAEDYTETIEGTGY